MKETINNLIQEAKDRGYVPEKKLIPHDRYRPETEDEAYNIAGRAGFNQAIDSYNLEKIIELAYEKGRE